MSKVLLSIDYDSTLSTVIMQNFIEELNAEETCEVYITTTRLTSEYGMVNNYPWIVNQNDDLFKITDILNIKRDNIIFTNGEDKKNYVSNYDIHLDDDSFEINLIELSSSKCRGILFIDKTSIEHVRDLIKMKSEHNIYFDELLKEMNDIDYEYDIEWNVYMDGVTEIEYNILPRENIIHFNNLYNTSIFFNIYGNRVDKMISPQTYMNPEEWISYQNIEINIEKVIFNGIELWLNNKQIKVLEDGLQTIIDE